MNRIRTFFSLLIVVVQFSWLNASAQTSNATVFGIVTDNNGHPVEMVNVSIRNYPFGTTTNKKGEYLLRVPSGREIGVVYSMVGYEMVEKTLNLISEQSVELNVVMPMKSEEIDAVTITNHRQTSGNVVKINPKSISALPGVGMGSVENVIATQPGVTSSNEMSSQYSVRGGSFDENLVYVNGIEIYRPSLIRSGQQEGLSFVNSDMVSSIQFSAGGFDAKYGDKMSSVLDIQYNRPKEFSASADVSLLGAKAQVENASANKKFTYNMGIRYKSFKFLLGTLDAKGTYDPSFIDFQGYFTYAPSPKIEIGFLGTASSNKYNFIPASNSTSTGTFNDQKRLNVYFEGKEVDRYSTYNGALNVEFKPTKNFSARVTASAYTTAEQETYDIIGYYFFNEVGGEGTVEQNDSIANLAVGFYHEHGRNFLDASVLCLDHQATYKLQNNVLSWGVNAKQEIIKDRTKEWQYRDSAGYSLPSSKTQINLFYTFDTDTSFVQQRYTAFIQDSYSVPLGIGYLMFTGGVRAHYWTYTDKISVSPRFSASLKTGGRNDVITRLSFGWYHQPAFYRELKDLYGNISPKIQTPYSIQAVAGVDFTFNSWGRPFRFTGETYYKSMKNLIPYQYENVRIRYLSNLTSKGYAYGLDLKVNGEFVSGTQSWISASLMKSMEDIEGDGHGWIRRPNDQRFKFSMFFQDYLPGLPAYQMHLTGHYITGIPFGLPRSQRWTQTATMESYKRVDIGFVRLLVSDGKNLTKLKFLDKFEDLSASIEVLNMIDIENVSSYTFIADFEGNYHGVADKLTGRMFNFKFSAAF